MRPTFQQSLAGLLMLAACSDANHFPGSELTRKNVEIRQRNDLSYMMRHPDTDDSFDGTLREAAFVLVKNMTAEQAVTVFQIDGAICDGRTCLWTYRDRETWAEVSFGKRPPGLRRTVDWFRSVTMNSEIIADLDDLSVRQWVEPVEASE